MNIYKQLFRTVKSERLHYIKKQIIRFFNEDNPGRMRYWVEQGLQLCSDDDKVQKAFFLNELATICLNEGKHYEAYTIYSNASRLVSSSESIWNTIHVNLAEMFLKEFNRIDDAKGYYNKVNLDTLKSTNKLVYFRLLLRMSELNGKFDSTIESLDRSISIIQLCILPLAFKELARSEQYYSQWNQEPILVLKRLIFQALNDNSVYLYNKYLQNGKPQDINNSLGSLYIASSFAGTDAEKKISLGNTASMKVAIAHGWTTIPESPEEIHKVASSAAMDFQDMLKMTHSLTPMDIARAKAGLSVCYKLLENLELAEELGKESVLLFSQILSSQLISDIRIDSSGNFIQALDDLSSVLLLQKKYLEALSYIEVGKAREMFTSIPKTSKGRGVRANLIGKLNRIDLRLKELISIQERRNNLNRLNVTLNNSQNDTDMTTEYISLFNNRRVIEDRLWKKTSEPPIHLPLDPPMIITNFLDLLDNQQNLNENTKHWAVLEFGYFQRSGILNIFVLDYKRHINNYKIKVDMRKWNEDLPNKIYSFRTALQNRSFVLAEKLLHELGSLTRSIIPNELIEKLNKLKIKQLMIIPEGILHNMPFELVKEHETESENECWGIKYGLVRGFSINQFSSQMKMTYSNSHKALIIGNPTDFSVPYRDIDSDVDSDILFSLDLPRAEIEATNISNMFRNKGGTPTLLVNKSCLRKNFISVCNKQNYSFVHFAGHAKFDDHNPNRGYLLLRDSGKNIQKLYANEIGEKIAFKGFPLVTLSSCESGTYRIKQGDEAFGLIRAFTLAGASNPIPSGWQVFDDSAQEFMEHFYSNLFERRTLSEAIASARRNILERARSGIYVKKVSALHWAVFNLWGLPSRRLPFEVS